MSQLWKQAFYRFNSHTNPMIYQRTDVVCGSRINDPDDPAFIGEMWDAMWEQNPGWLISAGPSVLGYKGWSSVMTEGAPEKIEYMQHGAEVPNLTGNGNMAVSMTFHPLLPDDLRRDLKKAFNRGLAHARKEMT